MKTQSTTPSLSNLRYIKGIGPKRAQTLEKIGVLNVRDLLFYFPRRYEDRSQFKNISDVKPGDIVTVKGSILSAHLKRLRRITILEAVLGDDSGMIPAVWFNQPYLKNQFTPGREVILFGRADFQQGRFQLNSPEYEILEDRDAAIHTGRITPIYPLTEGLYQKSFRSILNDVVSEQSKTIIQDFLPSDFRKARDLMPLQEAVQEMHFPASFESLKKARRRIVFDEFLLFELTLLEKIRMMKSRFQSPAFKNARSLIPEFKKILPFVLTESQDVSIHQIAADLEKSQPMNRLLMGDVGSGKTVVAAFALWAAAKSGYQGTILVPTETLALQHYENLKRLFQPLDVPVRLLTANTETSARERLLAELKQGKLPCLIGTHALLQEDVLFKSLGVVVIDEQHKFGVYQRCHLLDRNPRPHQLVMTATPIPRTLALTTYGDLDLSVMRGLPSGRKPVKTFWITRAKQPQVYAHILEKIKKGEQAYFIFPLVEETEKTDLLAAVNEFDKLQKGPFREVKAGLVHGRMPSAEREAAMKSFKEGKLQILVATSVIEVGVDNPNATVVVIENAERFGLSQLHQMRGRIGRGDKESECFLFGEPATDEGRKRLRILTRIQDGFQIAEEDLKLRGPGDFWGKRQSGEPLFRVANPVEDEALLLEVREAAREIVHAGGFTETGSWSGLKNYLDQFPIRY